jgi:deferrochelatase/peroxidase EfeB
MATILGPKEEKAMQALGKLPRGEAKAAQTSKEAILEILARAADDSNFLAQLADNPEKALSAYYVLSWEERAALASGDIKMIESWVGKLDKRLATWLWCRLSQEKW